MANDFNLSNLTEILYAARDRVARQAVGFIPSVTVNGGSEGVSINGTVESLRSVQPSIGNTYTPSMTIPAGNDVTPQKETMVIAQVANAKIPMQGESAFKLSNTGTGRETLTNTFAQAMNGIVNQIEAHVGTVAKNGASRAYGTAGTTPFAADFKSINYLRQILQDNGCAVDDGQMSLILSTSAGTNLRNLAQLTKANEAASADTLRKGTLLDVSGFMIKESAGIASHTKGTGAGYLVDLLAGYAVKDTAIHIDTGTGTIVPGDVLAFESDTNLYVTNTGCPGNGDQDIVIARPGLRSALADGKTVTVGNNYTANIGLHRSAIELVMRPPAQPEGGDAARDRMTLFDPVSGLVFEIALYAGYGMVMYDITVFYQAKVWNPEFVATLMG